MEFGLTNRDLTQFGGAVTFNIGEDHGNKNVRVFVNPNEVDVANFNLSPRSFAGSLRWAGQNISPAWHVYPETVETISWHEFGHAWGNINGRAETSSEAVQWENRIREQLYGPLGPNNAPRRIH